MSEKLKAGEGVPLAEFLGQVAYLQDAIYGHQRFRPDGWHPAAMFGFQWKAVSLAYKDEAGQAVLLIATTPDELVQSEGARSFYVNSCGRPLTDGGPTMWEWNDQMPLAELAASVPQGLDAERIMFMLQQGQAVQVTSGHMGQEG